MLALRLNGPALRQVTSLAVGLKMGRCHAAVMLNNTASASSGLPPITSKSRRRLVKAGHVHCFYRLRLIGGGTVLIATVAQGHVVPSTWASAYACLPDSPQLLVRDVHFETFRLDEYRQTYNLRSLEWLDSRFMLKLALEQCLMDIGRHLKETQGAESILPNPEPIDSIDLHVMRAQGALPYLQQLMEGCRDHLLLFQDLRLVHDLPAPTFGTR